MTEEQRQLITGWIEDARTLLHAHMVLSERLRGKHMRLGIPAAVLSGIVGTSVFAAIGKDPSVYAQITVGTLSVLASVLATLGAFLNYLDLSAKHHHAGASFAEIRKELEELLAFPPHDEAKLKAAIAAVRVRWDKIRREAMPLSKDILKPKTP